MLRGILPHLVIILAGIFLVFLILDQYNPTMEFVGNPISSILLALFCLLSIIAGILLARDNRQRAVRDRSPKINTKGGDPPAPFPSPAFPAAGLPASLWRSAHRGAASGCGPVPGGYLLGFL